MKIKKNWAHILLYVSAYLGAIPFALIGGFLFLYCKDPDIKSPLRTALTIFLTFVAADALHLILTDIFSAAGIYTVSFWFGFVLDIARITIYAVFAVIAFSQNQTKYYTFPASQQE